MKIKELINRCDDLTVVFGELEKEFKSVEYDSRNIKKDSLFVAVEGLVVDGHKYVSSAVKMGASVVIISNDKIGDYSGFDNENFVLLASSDTRKALSEVSDIFFGHPSGKVPVIGITGTNGKTSITYMLESIFKYNDMNPGVIGTINYRWSNKSIPAPNTTPESQDLQKLLFDMVNDGVDVVIMEVSSHGLDLGRVDHIDFDGGIFTNLTRDHLDYHKDFDSYFAAKKKLFSLISKNNAKNGFALINGDDEYGQKILENKDEYPYNVYSFGTGEHADYRLIEDSLENTIDSIKYKLKVDNSLFDICLNLAGKFSIYNSVAAIAAANKLGLSIDKAKMGLSKLVNIPGRFEKLKSDEGFYAIVDYAHTNDAIKKLLLSARELNPKRVITVFGCGGDRDKTKRPIMGQMAVEYSDYVIVTSDNPRTEDPVQIIEDILEGIRHFSEKYEIEINREKAIKHAIDIAQAGDFIVIAGKGHEDYQIIGKEKIHFDDKEIALRYIEERKKQ